VAARLEPREAARVSAEAAATLTQAMTKPKNAVALEYLEQGLTAVAARLGPKEAAEAAAALMQAMTRPDNVGALGYLAQGLSAVAARLEPKEAAEAAAALMQAMTRKDNAFALGYLAQGLTAVAARLEPREAARVSAEAAATLTQAMARTDTNYDDALWYLAQGLSAALGDGQRDKRAEAVAAAVGGLQGSQILPGALVVLGPAVEPFPRRFSDQALVDLLKHPLCVGPARRAVLDHLGMHYRRTFADQWEFVRFAEEQKLGLDFTTPPRPEAAAAAARP
jgi:hypothetical protein